MAEASNKSASIFIRSGVNGVFFKITGQEAQPLQGEAAVNAARQYLRQDIIKSEVSMTSVAAKLEAMACHASQMRESPSERSLDALESLARLRGLQVGVSLAEAFAPRRLLV